MKTVLMNPAKPLTAFSVTDVRLNRANNGRFMLLVSSHRPGLATSSESSKIPASN